MCAVTVAVDFPFPGDSSWQSLESLAVVQSHR